MMFMIPFLLVTVAFVVAISRRPERPSRGPAPFWVSTTIAPRMSAPWTRNGPGYRNPHRWEQAASAQASQTTDWSSPAWQAGARSIPVRRQGTGGRVLLRILGVFVMLAIAIYLIQQSPLAFAAFTIYWIYQACRAMARGGRKVGRYLTDDPVSEPIWTPPAGWLGASRRVAPEQILAALGYQHIQRLAGRGEMGMDFFARDRRQQTVLVQWLPALPEERTPSEHIAELIAAVERQQAAGGVAVTHGVFTPAAINLARHSRVAITLYDGSVVRSVVDARGMRPAA